MNIVIGADHGGYQLKELLVERLTALGHIVRDVGAYSREPSDYPDYARSVAGAMIDGRADRGVLICGSGVGACIAANKFPGIRAAICHDTYSAHQGVEDDDMNVLCLGARAVGPELAKEITKVFIEARFSSAERHVRRLDKVMQIERETMK